jgi:hypothetical protein
MDVKKTRSAEVAFIFTWFGLVLWSLFNLLSRNYNHGVLGFILAMAFGFLGFDIVLNLKEVMESGKKRNNKRKI